MNNAEEIRPAWGDEAEVVGEWSLHWTHIDEAPRVTITDYLDRRIAEFTAAGDCAMCMNRLDDAGVCGVCGFNPSAPRQPEWTPEQQDDYSVRLPQQMLIDEFAPAEVDS